MSEQPETMGKEREERAGMTTGRQDEAPQRVSRRTLVPADMSADERARFARDLYAVHSHIFSGVSMERFASHVVEPPAEHTAIQVFEDETGRLVGYCAFHRYARALNGEPVIVLRAEAGLLPEYRGKALAHWFGMFGALREKLRHPFTRVFYFGTLVHPSSYRFFCKYFPTIFPRHDQDAPDDIRALAIAVADSWEDPAVSPDAPLVRDVGWVTIETLEHPAFISDEGRADIRYFETVNPGYTRGHGLVVLLPVTLGNVSRAILKRVTQIVAGWLRRRRHPL